MLNVDLSDDKVYANWDRYLRLTFREIMDEWGPHLLWFHDEDINECVNCTFVLHLSLLFYLAFTTLYEFEPPHSRGSKITHKDAPQSVGLLWTSDQPLAETSTWQHTQHLQQTTIHAPGGIRTSNPSKRSAVDTHLRPLGHWDRHYIWFYLPYIFITQGLRVDWWWFF
jgi:hypothetical protein